MEQHIFGKEVSKPAPAPKPQVAVAVEANERVDRFLRAALDAPPQVKAAAAAGAAGAGGGGGEAKANVPIRGRFDSTMATAGGK
jgi:hypothetical protein